MQRRPICDLTSCVCAALSYPASTIQHRCMLDELTSLGGELAEYSQEQSFWALRFLSAVLRGRASFLKLKTYFRVWKPERLWPYRTNRSCRLDLYSLEDDNFKMA